MRTMRDPPPAQIMPAMPGMLRARVRARAGARLRARARARARGRLRARVRARDGLGWADHACHVRHGYG